MMKRFIPILIAAACLLPLFFNWGCANTTQSPTGGPKDTLPPLIIGINPLPGTVNVPVHDARIVFTFDEYVTIKTPGNIFLSPPQQKIPKSKISGKNLIVSFEDDLLPGTTYTLSLDDAIADNNEGNMFAGFSYVFSTGNAVDSMLITGTVLDCNKLLPVKGATVMVYKDHSDSAVFKKRPYAAVKTDDWGFFTLPYIKDTLYRLYAVQEQTPNNIYDPESDLIAFCDSLVRPRMKVCDTLKEMLKYDMTDTVAVKRRNSEHQLVLFKEKPTKQALMNRARVSDRSAYITFMAPNAYIDSLWIPGYGSRELITQFNLTQDSLEIWINTRKPAPDTLHLFVNYRKTDSLGRLEPELEHLRLAMEKGQKLLSRKRRSEIKHEDTTCVVKLSASPETVEQDGYKFEFKLPIIYERFKDVTFKMISPKQKESFGEFDIIRDSLDLKIYNLKPKDKFLPGYEYILKIPEAVFTDINGFRNDSTELKLSLPKDDKLSSLVVPFRNVDRKIIVELMNEQKSNSLRTYIIDADTTLSFPYLKAAKYTIRITDDGNRNLLVDTGSLLEHRQPEKVRFYSKDNIETIDIPESSEVEQIIDLKEVMK